MRPLFFQATVGTRPAHAIAAQAHESLRPYVAYLKSSIRGARAREARSTCPWEAVPDERRVRIEPLDQLVTIARTGFTYRVRGIEAAPEGMPLFVGARFRPVDPISTEASPHLRVTLAEELPEGDAVFWAGLPCDLEREPTSWPSDLAATRADGSDAAIRARFDQGERLVLVVEGTAPVTLLASRAAVDTLPLDAADGARLLGTGPWDGERTIRAPRGDTDLLVADNGVRWRVRAERTRRTRGVWIQILLPEDLDSNATVDPRSAYCEDGVREVRTTGRGRPYKVLGFRRDAYRLELDRLPPPGSLLHVPENTGNARRQRQAAFRLKDSPLPHHRALLALCEDPARVHWPRVTPSPVDSWHLLTDDRFDGTTEQRQFVEIALGTPDFAFLEGPPGSGKTHTICELILQLVDRGLRVLLCSTTHAAVDNVLERLVGRFLQVDAVRIGLTDRVDEAVRKVQIDERVEELLERWSAAGALPGLDDRRLHDAAEAAVLSSANLTCGTTIGIGSHPWLRRDDDVSRRPQFDVLILDEASKTTVQEFLVPAQLARRWVVVGDVAQLPPFSNPKDLEASIDEVTDERPDGTVRVLGAAHKRALLILFRLLRREAGGPGVRWLIEEPADVLDALMAELAARRARGQRLPIATRVVDGRPGLDEVHPTEDGRGAAALWSADWVLVTPALRERFDRHLPSHALPLREQDASSTTAFRFAWWAQRHGLLDPPARDGRQRHDQVSSLLDAQIEFLRDESWAAQIAWRVGRVHQLASAKDDAQRTQKQAEVDSLMPARAGDVDWVPMAVSAIREVGVRSVLEAVRVPRGAHGARRRSALTEALPRHVWGERGVLLAFQHRMHPDLSALPREQFYDGLALRDANTLEGRDARAGFDFATDAPSRRVWLDVLGREERGINAMEIDAVRVALQSFARFAESTPRADDKPWELACLAFYARQAIGLRDMLRTITGLRRAETRFRLPNLSISCGTVDRFQGREADVVLLSLRNTSRAGHIDSPNRLNVGITRARFLLAVVGNRSFFERRCRSEELRALATATPTHRFEETK